MITDVLAEVGRRSFWWYLCYGFGARSYCLSTPSDNWLSTRVHAPFSYWLEGHIKEWLAWRAQGIRRPKKLLIDAFRGFGKSTIGSALDQWIQLQDPEIAEILSSYDIEKSKEFINVTRGTWEGASPYSLFPHLYGQWNPHVLDPRTWRDGALTHARRVNPTLRDYSVKASSVGKGFTGGRPDVFRYDDPIVKEKLREEKNWVTLALEHHDSAKFAIKSNGLSIYFLTPYLEGDVADRVLREEGVATWSGAKAPRENFYKKGGLWHVWFRPIRDSSGKSVLPQVYPDELLAKMEEEDPDDFASQMMCDPAEGLNMPLKMGDIQHLWVEPDHVPNNLAISIHLDTAFKDPKRAGTGDFSVIEIWGHDRGTGTVYYLDGWRSNTATGAEFINQLVIILQDLRNRRKWPYVVTDERSGGGKEGLFEQFLLDACRSNGIPCPNLIKVSRSTSKEDRILQAIYAWKAGRVRLVRGAGCVGTLVYEMTHIKYAKRDMADAGADVFHPEVYIPALGSVDDQPKDRGRPYDQLMWARPGTLSNAEIRTIYDEDEHLIAPRREDYAIH